MTTSTPGPDLQAFLQAVPGPYLVLLPDAPRFTIAGASDAYLDMTLVPRDQAVGRGIFEVYPEENPGDANPTGAADLVESLDTVLRTRAPHRMTHHRYDIRLPDGSWAVRWWAAHNTPVLGEQGEVRYILHYAEDVTERASRTRFRRLAAVLEELHLARSLDQVFEVLQSGSRRLLGASGSSLILREENECHYVTCGPGTDDLWAGRRFPLGSTIAGWAMLHRRTAVVENVFDDPRVPVELYEPTPVRSIVMVPVGAPEPFAAIGTYWGAARRHDPEEVAVLETLARAAGEVLERARAAADIRAAEQALRESEARYRTLFDSIDSGFCVVEVLFDEQGRAADYRFLEVNHAFERQSGISGALGRRMREIAPAHEQYWFELYGHVARTGARVRFENPAKALGRWFDVDAFRVGEPSQHRVAILFTDITERVKAAERLREAGRLEAIGALAGGVAHEANNQMSIVLGFADFVLRRPDLAADVREDVEQMRRAAERTALVTGQLLAFGRRQVLHPAVLELNRVVEGVAPALVRTLGVDSQLALELVSEQGRVLADSRQLEQVLINLTLNARDAMPDGGTLTIRTDDVTFDGSVLLPGNGEPVPAGRYVRLVVEDSGHGIDPAIRDRIFEPFFTTKPLGHGTGLGLSSVYGIVKQSGGYIAVDEGESGGARFTIHLPQVEEPATPAAAAAPRGTAGHGETVLVVEDEPAVRSIIARILTEEGYRVVTADHGHAALELLEREQLRPRLVLTDVAMPRMGGRALANELEARYPGVPVVFLSGYSEGSVEPGPGGAPEAAFVQKPVSPDELVRVVREVMGGKGGQ